VNVYLLVQAACSEMSFISNLRGCQKTLVKFLSAQAELVSLAISKSVGFKRSNFYIFIVTCIVADLSLLNSWSSLYRLNIQGIEI
jgi:hypothetical protein